MMMQSALPDTKEDKDEATGTRTMACTTAETRNEARTNPARQLLGS